MKLTQRVGSYEITGEFRTVDEALRFLREWETQARKAQPEMNAPGYLRIEGLSMSNQAKVLRLENL